MKHLLKAVQMTLNEMVGNEPDRPKKKIETVTIPEPIMEPVEQKEESVVENNVPVIPGADRKLPMKSPESVKKFIEENPSLVSDYFLKRLKVAIKNDLSEIILFRLGESKLIAKIEYKNYEEQLKKLIEFYIKSEQYEKVVACNKLLERHFINRVIGESKK
jgi:hypothetical protein